METKGLIHVSAPDHPEAGASKPSLGEGSGCYARGPGPHEGSGTSAGVRTPREVRSPRLFGLSACFFRNTWCSQTFPSRGTGPGPLSGEHGSDRKGPAVRT